MVDEVESIYQGKWLLGCSQIPKGPTMVVNNGAQIDEKTVQGKEKLRQRRKMLCYQEI